MFSPCRLPFLLIAVVAMLNVVAAAAVAAVRFGCDPLSLSYIEYENERSTTDVLVSGRRFVVEASNNLLRELNNKTFSGWTFGSEFVSNLMHFRFLVRFQEIMDALSKSSLQKVATPYAKLIEITTVVEGVESKSLAHMVDLAKQAALEDAGDFFYAMTATSRKKFIASTFDSVQKLGGIEGSEFSRAPDFDQVERIIVLLRQSFSSRDEYLWTVDRSYQIGVGTTALDAQFAARMGGSVESSSVTTHVFSLKSFEQILVGIERQRERIGDGLQQLGEKEQLSLFEALRKGYGYEKVAKEPTLAQLLETIRQKTNYNDKAPENLWAAMRQYVRTLNFIDHLPFEWFQIQSRKEDVVEKLRSKVTGIMAFDGKGLGARNFMRFHQTAPKLLAKLRSIDLFLSAIRDSTQKTERIDDPRVFALFDELNTMRREVLAQSNADLQQTAEYLRKSISEALPPSAKVEVWNSGDDFILAIAGGNREKMKDGLVASLRRGGAPLELRGAMIAFDGRTSMNLPTARELLAEPMALVKNSENEGEAGRYVEGIWNGSRLRFDLRMLDP